MYQHLRLHLFLNQLTRMISQWKMVIKTTRCVFFSSNETVLISTSTFMQTTFNNLTIVPGSSVSP